jgi:serine/threonine protein kinase
MLIVIGHAAVGGTPFGRYRLLSLLGEGGMSEVWRAHDTVTDREVAIKLLPPKLSKDEEFQERFRRESHAAARLNTPHAVPIYDYGEIDGRLFVSMRLIEGRDLATVLADGPLAPTRALRVIEGVALALHAAHQAGLLHRDVKPSNILLDDNDFAYLIDFGIARATDDTRITKTGNAVGTFAYIAPERLDRHGKEDARVDIYSLACVLYECLTGEPPFTDDTIPRLMMAHLHFPPPRPSSARSDLPPQVDEVIATGMAKEPDRRYATTVELADAARNAITEPIGQPAPPPTAITEPIAQSTPAPALRPMTQQEPERVPAPPMIFNAGPPAPASSPAPPPAWPIPATARSSNRGRTVLIAAGALAFVVAIVAVVGIYALGKQRPPASSPTSSPASTAAPEPVAPNVVATEPAEGATVPAGPFKLKVTFDQRMTADTYSFVVIQGIAFPPCQMAPKISADGMTFSVDCTLAAGTHYALSFNGGSYMNFKNEVGVAAVPSVLHFSTAP